MEGVASTNANIAQSTLNKLLKKAMTPNLNQDIARAITRCWVDPVYKHQLIENPLSALKSIGIDVPANMKINFLENTEDSLNIVIPAAPANIGSVSETHGVTRRCCDCS